SVRCSRLRRMRNGHSDARRAANGARKTRTRRGWESEHRTIWQRVRRGGGSQPVALSDLDAEPTRSVSPSR
ncbi:hypothetical protein AB0346_28235, partial [Nocardia beijingensis]|uniref:hypothetical protein n=1 Tax=Nocardia beijingensis TaxID=95162 RepID=UPI00344D6198